MGVNLHLFSSDNSKKHFAVKALSGDDSSTVKLPRPEDLSWSSTKAPYSNRVSRCCSSLYFHQNFSHFTISFTVPSPRFDDHQFVNGCVSNQGSAGGVLLLADAEAENSGAKASGCGRLASLAAASDKGSRFVGQNFYLSLGCKVFCFWSFSVGMCY